MLIKRGGFTSIENLFLSVVSDLIESGFVLKYGPTPSSYKEATSPVPMWTLESGPQVDPLSDHQAWRIRFDATAKVKYGWQVVQTGVTDYSLGQGKITPFRKYSFQRNGRVIVGTSTNLPSEGNNAGMFAKYITFDDSKLVSTAVDKIQTYFKGYYDDSLSAYIASLTGAGDLGAQGAAGSSRPIANDYLTPYQANARVNKDLFIDWIDANQDEFGEELNDDLILTGQVNPFNINKNTLIFDNTATIFTSNITKYLQVGNEIEFWPEGATTTLSGGIVTEILVTEGFQENESAKGYIKLGSIRGTFNPTDRVKRAIVNVQGTPISDIMDDYTGTRLVYINSYVQGTDSKWYLAKATHVEDSKYTPVVGSAWATMFTLTTVAPTTSSTIIPTYGIDNSSKIRHFKIGQIVRGCELSPTGGLYSYWRVTVDHWESYKFAPGTTSGAGALYTQVFEYVVTSLTSPVADSLTVKDYATGGTSTIPIPFYSRKLRDIQAGTLIMGVNNVIYVCTETHIENPSFYPGLTVTSDSYFALAERKVIVGTIDTIVDPILYNTLAAQNWSQHWVGVAVRDKSSITMDSTSTDNNALYTGVKWDAGKKELQVSPSVDKMFWVDAAGNPKDLEIKIIRSNLKFGYTNFRVVPGDLGYALSDSEINDGRPASYVLSVTDRGIALAMSTEAMSFIEASDLSSDEAFLKFGRNSEIILKDRGPYANNLQFGYSGYAWLVIQRLCNAKTDETLINGDSPVVCWYMFPTYTKYIAELIQVIDPAFAIKIKVVNGNDPRDEYAPATSKPSDPTGMALLSTPDTKVFLGNGDGPFSADQLAFGFVKMIFNVTSGSQVQNTIVNQKVYDWSSGDIAGTAQIYKLTGTWANSADPANDPWFLYTESGAVLGQITDLTMPTSFNYLESYKLGTGRNIRQIVLRESDITSPSAPVDVDKPSDYVNTAVNHRKQISISNKDEYILNIPDGINTRRNLYHNDRLDMVGFISGSVVSEGTYAEVTMNTGSVCEDVALKKRKYLGSRTSVGNNEGSRLMILAKGGNVTSPVTTAATLTPLAEGQLSYPINTDVLIRLDSYGSDKTYYTWGATDSADLLTAPSVIAKKDVNMSDPSTSQVASRAPIVITRSTVGSIFIKAFSCDVAENAEPIKTFVFTFANYGI